MRRLIFWALILALCTAHAQQIPNSGATSLAGAGCGIEGVVVNGQTGEPVRKAQITAMREGSENASNQGPAYAVSDVSGHFSITGLEPGRYHLDVEADRFASQAYGARRPGGAGKPLELAQGQTLRDVSIRLLPAGVITGTVRDEDGDPMLNTMVQVIPVGRVRVFQNGNQGETNDLGAYRIYGLVPGTYLVQANPQQHPERGESSGRTYEPTFYPGVTSPASAATISVQPGAEIDDINIDLKPVRAVAVRGRIVNQTGGMGQGAWVGLIPRASDPDPVGEVVLRTFSGPNYNTGVQDPQGDFEIHGVPAGSYWIVGTVQDNRRQYQGRAPLEVGDSDVQGLVLPVNPGASLIGRVRIDPPKPLNYSSLSVNLTPEDGTLGGAGTQAKTDGGFAIQDVNAGSYRINVAGFPEDYYVKSAKLGGVDVLESGLTVDSASPGSLEIVLSPQGGKITGAVFRDHQPAPSTVFLVPNPPRRNRLDLYSEKSTKADGTFTLLGLPPGDFKLFAFEDPDPNMWADPSLLQPYEGKGQTVHVEDGSSQSVQLELIPAEAEQ